MRISDWSSDVCSSDLASQTTVLTLHDVHKSFGEAHIIRGVDLDLRQGERHAIIGPNGAGKSTLFHLISGLVRPSSCEILLHGNPIHGLYARTINRLDMDTPFQLTKIFPGLIVF